MFAYGFAHVYYVYYHTMDSDTLIAYTLHLLCCCVWFCRCALDWWSFVVHFWCLQIVLYTYMLYILVYSVINNEIRFHRLWLDELCTRYNIITDYSYISMLVVPILYSLHACYMYSVCCTVMSLMVRLFCFSLACVIDSFIYARLMFYDSAITQHTHYPWND